jgi:hypothetical protein
MGSATPQQVRAATRQWLRPLVQVLLRSGVTWREFSELAKTVYVEMATRHFGRRGRPTNVSRTAVLTGLTRRDVRKLRESLAAKPDVAASGYVAKASMVLSAWHMDADFLDSNGLPRRLRPEGEGATFTTLVHRCGGSDVPATTLLKELINAGAVRQHRDGRLQALQRNYIPHDMDEELIRLWGSVLADIGNAYVHNLTRSTRTPARFERAAVNDRIDARALPEFRRFLEAEGQAFLERVDAWLAAHEVNAEAGTADEKAIRLGAGVYHVQDE